MKIIIHYQGKVTEIDERELLLAILFGPKIEKFKIVKTILS